MNDSIPWYRSAVLQGVLTSILAQALARSNLAAVITPDQAVGLVNWALDGLSGLALAYAAHGRVAKPTPPVTFSKQTPPPAQGDSHATLPPGPEVPPAAPVSAHPGSAP